jgi:hypothetical protein
VYRNNGTSKNVEEGKDERRMTAKERKTLNTNEHIRKVDKLA